jgi:hypothetical protein
VLEDGFSCLNHATYRKKESKYGYKDGLESHLPRNRPYTGGMGNIVSRKSAIILVHFVGERILGSL